MRSLIAPPLSLLAQVRSLLAPPLCWSCRSPTARGAVLCLGCRRALRFLPADPVRLSGVRVWAAVAYEGPARDLVRALKFRGALALADELAAIVVASAPEELLRGVLVPVPLRPARRRRRGFNQAATLAAAIARRTGLAVADCLARRDRAPPQVGRGRGARLGLPAGSIEAHAAV
ncbi:MAG: ComF family protein, partial [Thermoleophilaceae bacterium]